MNLDVNKGKTLGIATLALPNQFPTEDYAYLAVKMPNVECNRFRAYTDASNIEPNMVMITGKGKPFLSLKKEAEKIRRYEEIFNELVAKYRR